MGGRKKLHCSICLVCACAALLVSVVLGFLELLTYARRLG